jgi:hypothetical protein
MTQVVTFDFGGKFSPVSYENLLTSIAVLAKKSRDVLVLGCREEDCNPLEHYAQTIALQEHIHNLGMKFCVLFNFYTQYTQEHLSGIDVDYIDFMLLKTIHNAPAPIANQGSRILFLIGKPDRPHRAPLLYKFYERDQLDQLSWSLFIPAEIENQVRELIPHVADQQWQEFMKLQGSPDGVTPIVSGSSIHVCNYCHYDAKIFADTNVSLVSESMFEQSNTLTVRATEKTYKAINNRHPFVIAGPTGTLERLQSLGYKTFEKYLPHPGYDQEFNNDVRLELIYENILALHKLATEHPESLANDVEHNYTVNKQRYQQQLDRAAAMLAKYGYNGRAIDVLMLHDQVAPNTLTEKFMELI